MKVLNALALVLGLAVAATAHGADTVIEDGGVGISRAELEYIVRNWTPQMQAAAANDLGDRLELLNMALASKRIAEDARKLTPADGDIYWKSVLMERAVLRKFMVDEFLNDIEIPDMTELARERYKARRDFYARMPEQRLSSHILVKCDTKMECIPAEAEQKAERILAELEKGASFEELAKKYSDDKRSGAAGGRYDRWLTENNKVVAPEYVAAVFGLEKPGDRTGVMRSRFGYHIIRLDEIKPEHYRSFEESKADIVAELEQEYKELNAKAFDAKYRITDEAFIDGKAMEEVFAPYRSAPAAAPPATNPQ